MDGGTSLRTTYTTKQVVFPPDRVNTRIQRATKIVVHRQGNPGVEGENGMEWGRRTGTFSIHYYVDDGMVLTGIPGNRHAFHVKESRKAAEYGLPPTGEYGPRGDYNTIGVECEDESTSSDDLAPGQTYGLSRETRITLVHLLADIIRDYPWLGTDDIIEHANLDPWTRPEDLGNALNILDLRADVADVIARREPWRTVGRYATGQRNTSGQAPGPTEPGPSVTGGNAYIVAPGDTLAAIAVRMGLTLDKLAEINTIDDVNKITVGQVLRLSSAAPMPQGAARQDLEAAYQNGYENGRIKMRDELLAAIGRVL